MIEVMRLLISLGLLSLLSQYAGADDEILPPDFHYCQEFQKDDPNCSYNEAFGFTKYEALTQRQRDLINPILEKFDGHADEISFQKWTVVHNDFAAEFMALTQALSRLKLIVAENREIESLDLISQIIEVRGDRIKVKFDPTVFEKWKDGKGKFRVDLADGKHQNGRMEFADHTVFGKGILMDEFDFQWFSGITSKNSPRFHFNFRLKDGIADLHLDVAVWIWGFIPNFAHMTYGGSDPRQYYKKVVKRFGYPEFTVRKRIIPN